MKNLSKSLFISFFIVVQFTLLAPRINKVLANENSVGELPVISLLTCSPGGELYSTFGHSALRVYYPKTGQDLVFNFGMFDFNTPNFYSRFVRGKLEYMLGIQYMDDFLYQYRYENRSVVEQILQPDSSQTIAIMNRLEYLYRPQNRYYLYSFLYKNCTTELRDLILSEAGTENDFFNEKIEKTNRTLINEYITGWTKFGISIILGSSLDSKIDNFQSMFLPDYLYSNLSKAYNGEVLLVKEEETLFERTTPERKRAVWETIFSPFAVFAALLLLISLTLYKGRYRFIEYMYLLFFGLLGTFLLLIISITDHTELYNNYNLLWCNPLWVVFVITSRLKSERATKIISIVFLVLLTILAVVWISGLQYAHSGFVVIAITMAISAIYRVTGKRL